MYRRLAGEIESRDVQARADYTPRQREEIAPYSSENIAPEDAILKFDNGSDELKGKYRAEMSIDEAHQKGAFGRIFTEFKNDYKKAKEALLKEKSGDALGALQHKELGDIDLIYGVEGSGKSDGMGLAKIAKFHPEVLDDLDKIIYDMPIVQRSKNRVKLESEKHFASIRLDYDGITKHWLLTAFKKSGDTHANRTDTSEALAKADGMTTPSSNEKIIPQHSQTFDDFAKSTSTKSTKFDTLERLTTNQTNKGWRELSILAIICH